MSHFSGKNFVLVFFRFGSDKNGRTGPRWQLSGFVINLIPRVIDLTPFQPHADVVAAVLTLIQLGLPVRIPIMHLRTENNKKGRDCGGHIVGVFAYFSDDQSSNPTGVNNFYLYSCLNIAKNKEKEAWG